MKTNDFAVYRQRIGQTQEKIADILGIPLEIYKEIEDNKRKVSKRVSDAFYRLLTRFPGSSDLSKPTIKAIDEYKAQYKFKTGELPVGGIGPARHRPIVGMAFHHDQVGRGSSQ